MTASRASTFFDSYARDFDAIYGTQGGFIDNYVNKFLRKSMMLRYERTLAGCDPIEGRSVIDIGCGPGHYGIALARRGAGSVWGIDFAPGMIDLAVRRAQAVGVADRCRFTLGDFLADPIPDRFDYAIVMGFMDYIREPEPLIDKVLSVARSKAFFSFPVAEGVLAWQRKLRYRSRCDLFLYSIERVRGLFADLPARDVAVERISRDYFVTVDLG